MFFKKHFKKLGIMGGAAVLAVGAFFYQDYRNQAYYKEVIPVLKYGTLLEVTDLFKNGLRASVKDKTGNTPVFKVSQYNINPTVARAVARKTRRKNIANKKGYTPLMLASSRNVRGVVRALIEEGFPINAQAQNGLTALMLAVKNNPRTDVVQVLLSHGADVHQKSDWGMSALHYGVLRRTPAVTEALLDAGADANVVDMGGRTPLIWTVLKGQTPKMIEALIKHGARINQTDERGRTPLMYALSLPGREDFVLELLKFGPDLFLQDPQGQSALDYAKKNFKLPQKIYDSLNKSVKNVK